jgi:hypothetical protein
MKLIFSKENFNNMAEIYGDEMQYIVKLKNGESWYLPDLEICFRNIFEYVLRKNLMESTIKTCEEIIRIVKETKQNIEKIWLDSDKLTLETPKR